jgi:hypothetical protein
MDSMGHIQEVEDLAKLNDFSRLVDDERGIPGKLWDKWWGFSKTVNDIGEGILRFANYLTYKEQIRRNGGTPEHFGASDRNAVDALESVEDKAYWLANDTMGAYDKLSVAGQWLRQNVIPFWSFQEANVRRLAGLIRNDWKKGGIKAGLGVARTAAKMYTLSVALQAYSMTVAGKGGDENVPENARETGAYAYLGKGDDETAYFSRLGNLSDITEWIGLDHSPRVFAKFLTGRYSLGEAMDALVAPYRKTESWQDFPPVEKLFASANPAGYLKTLAELYIGESTFPSATKRRPISDPYEHLARSFALDNLLYKPLTRLTSRPKPQDLRNGWGGRLLDAATEALVYTEDNGKAAYDETRADVRDFVKRGGGSMTIDPKSEALARLKLALRYNDETAAKAALADYAVNHGTLKDAAASIAKLHPLSGVPKKRRREFFASLDDRQRERVKSAVDYYRTRIKPGELRDDVRRLWGSPEVREARGSAETEKRIVKAEIVRKEKAVGRKKIDVLMEMMEGR